jgi:hypothetical protein
MIHMSSKCLCRQMQVEKFRDCQEVFLSSHFIAASLEEMRYYQAALHQFFEAESFSFFFGSAPEKLEYFRVERLYTMEYSTV